MIYSDLNPWKDRIRGLEDEQGHHDRASRQIGAQLENATMRAGLWEARANHEPDADAGPGEWFPPPTSGW